MARIALTKAIVISHPAKAPPAQHDSDKPDDDQHRRESHEDHGTYLLRYTPMLKTPESITRHP